MNNSGQNIAEILEKTFTTSSFYWQSISVIVCVLLAILLNKASRKFFANNPVKNVSSKFLKEINKYFSPIFLPFLITAFLSITTAVFLTFSSETFLLHAAIQVAILFIFLHFLKITFDSKIIINIAAIILVPAIILNTFGVLSPTIIYLNSDALSINLGSIKISVYTIIRSAGALLIIFWSSGLVSKKTKEYFRNRKDIKPSTRGIISKVIDITIYCTVFLVSLKVFGIDLTAFAVMGGAIGVGIGFGLQKISSNFISGIILILEKSVKVGDLIDLDAGAIYGTITRFSGRYILIETFDGREIMVPNEDFITSKVTNWTFNDNRGRVEFSVGVSYGSDIRKAKEIIIQTVKAHPRCAQDPEPGCFVTEFADSSVNLMVHFWVTDVMQGRLGPKSDVMIEMFERFKENNIEIPFPQREVLLKEKNS